MPSKKCRPKLKSWIDHYCISQAAAREYRLHVVFMYGGSEQLCLVLIDSQMSSWMIATCKECTPPIWILHMLVKPQREQLPTALTSRDAVELCHDMLYVTTQTYIWFCNIKLCLLLVNHHNHHWIKCFWLIQTLTSLFSSYLATY